MNFRLSVTIATYLIFTIVFPTLCSHASQDKNENAKNILFGELDLHPNHYEKRAKVLEQKWKIFSRLLVGNNKLQTVHIPQTSLFVHLVRKKHIFYVIFHEFLVMKDILVLREACQDFQNLLQPNHAQMVTLCKHGDSKTIPIFWDDLKYFLAQSYYSVFDEMKMFNIKINQYAVLTRVPGEHIIFCNNNSPRYSQILLHQATQNTHQNSYSNQIESLKIFNKQKNAWTIINNKEENVTTGGSKQDGGDSKIVQSQLQKVQLIVPSYKAFAAVLANGHAVAWGNENNGGKISDKLQNKLKNVKTIVSTNFAFAALLNDGQVVAWGDELNGGNIPDDIQTQLNNNVKMIFATNYAFAALLNDGRVVVWGNKMNGGNIPDTIQKKLKNVKMIFSTKSTFAALLKDGRLVTWGNIYNPCTITPEQSMQPADRNQLHEQNIKMISSTDMAFAALTNNGRVVAWGNRNYGGKIPRTTLEHVKIILSTSAAFAALLNDGSVLTWGDPFEGNIPDEVQKQLVKNVKMIFSTKSAFSALLNDGRVVAWGDENAGGKIPNEIQTQLQNVKFIIPTTTCFIAVCENGKMFKWPEN